MADKLFSEMKAGSDKAILSGLASKGGLDNVAAIIFTAQYRKTNPAFICRLRRLTEKDVMVLGRTISDYAYAALDVLGIEEYTGTRKEVFELIESQFAIEL